MIQKVSVWLAAFQLSQCFQNSPEARCFLVGCHRLGAQIHFTESLIHLEFSENSQNSSGFLAQQMENRSHGRWCCSCCSVTKSCLTLCDPMNCSTPGFFPCPSLTPGIAQIRLSWWCCLTILSSATLFSFCLQSFLALGSFPMSQLFTSGSQSIGASASVLSMNVCVCYSLSCIRLFVTPMDCSLPGSSVHGIFLAITLKWVAIPFSTFQWIFRVNFL